MLGRARRDAQAVAGGLRAAVTRPGPPGPSEDGPAWSGTRLPSGRRQPALAGAMRPAVGGRATAGGAGRPDRKWQASDRQRAPAVPGGSLQRDGPPAEIFSAFVWAMVIFTVSPRLPVPPSPCLQSLKLNHGKMNGEPEGIAFPRRGPGAAPRPPEARR